MPFYPGWSYVHSGWTPVGFSYADQEAGTFTIAATYFTNWSSPVLAFAIFGLFGLTQEARDAYWRVICTIGGLFGWKPTPLLRKDIRPSLGSMGFGARSQIVTLDVEMGYVRVSSSLQSSHVYARSHPSFVNSDEYVADQGVPGNGPESRNEEKVLHQGIRRVSDKENSR